MDTNQVQTYSIFINPQHLNKLRENIWNDEPLPATLEFSKERYKIALMYRGSHIREFPKKSYEISFIKPGFFFSQTTIHLNAEYIDPSFMRNKLSFDFFMNSVFYRRKLGLFHCTLTGNLKDCIYRSKLSTNIFSEIADFLKARFFTQSTTMQTFRYTVRWTKTINIHWT